MLLRKETLDKIKAGEVSLAFRKWKRPTVKTGGSLTTRIGVLSILSVEPVTIEQVRPADLAKAGITDRQEWERWIEKKEGDLYRIRLAFAGEDPRVALRNEAALTPDDIDGITAKLDGFDRRSNHGPWAFRVLHHIKQNPGQVSTEIAEAMDVERFWLKGNIRKLKKMGLTISLGVGYKLSPRGEAYLAAVSNNQPSLQ